MAEEVVVDVPDQQPLPNPNPNPNQAAVNPNQEAVGNPQNAGQENRERKRRTILGVIGAVCMAVICFGLLPKTDFYTELRVLQQWLPIWVLGIIYVIQLLLGVWVVLRGPFKRELTDSKFGAIAKSVIEGTVAVLCLLFTVAVVKQRGMTRSYLHKHPEDKGLKHFNLVDLPLLVTTALLAFYSLTLSFLLQPGWDFSVMGLFLNLLLSLVLEFTVTGIHASEWGLVLIILYSYILFMGKNMNEYTAKSLAKEKEENANALAKEKVMNARISSWVQIPLAEVEAEGVDVARPDNIDSIGQSFITKAHRRRRAHPTISV